MRTLNKVQLIGRLGKDPDVRYFDNDRCKANFPLATNESYKDKSGQVIERTDWHNIICWGPLAKIVEQYIKKPAPVYIEGSLRTRSYEQDGVTKYITEIVANEIIMLEGKNAASNGYSQQQAGGAMEAKPVSNEAAAVLSTVQESPASMGTTATPSTTAGAAEEEDDLPF